MTYVSLIELENVKKEGIDKCAEFICTHFGINNSYKYKFDFTNELLNKLNLIGKNLNKYSAETVKGFYTDAKKSGFNI